MHTSNCTLACVYGKVRTAALALCPLHGQGPRHATASSTVLAPTAVVLPSVYPARTTSTSAQVCTGFVSSLCCVGRLIDPPSSWCKVCTDFYLRTKYRFPRSFGDRSRPCLPESCDRFALLGDIRVCRDHWYACYSAVLSGGPHLLQSAVV